MLDRFGSFAAGISVCYRYLQRIKTMEMTELGLKGTQVMCLFQLHQNPEGLTAAQLCRLCEEDKGAVSRILSELEQGGYVRLPESGGKKYRALLTLTDRGEAAALGIEERIGRWVEAGGRGLTAEQRDNFYATLEQIAGNLKDHYEKR